jgi:geranylgeranyl pyrophosphate synthase
MLDPEETIHRIKKEHLSLVIVYALQNPEMTSVVSSLLKKTITKKDAEKLSTLVDKAGGFARMDKCMQELALKAYNTVEKAKFNKNYLALLIQGMLLPEWRIYLPQR